MSVLNRRHHSCGRTVLFLVGCLIAVSWNATTQAASKYTLTVKADRAGALYKTGEQATFRIQVTCDGQPVPEGSVSYAVDDYITDHPEPNSYPKGSIELEDGIAAIPVTSDRPLFLRCRVSFVTPEKKQLQAVGGLGFSPLEIKPSLPLPNSFDKFWAEQKKQLAELSMQPKLTLVGTNKSDVAAFDVQLKCLGGAPVSGYLALPSKAKPGSLPIVLWVQGAGVRSSSLGNALKGAQAGMLSMDINAHGLPNGKPAEYYSGQAKGRLAGYPQSGRESRDTSYFRGMFLRIVRAIDYLTSRPEWDGKVVAVIGHSQGGGQALVAGGIDSRVTFIAAGVPAICDHSGRVINRINGWPKLVPLAADGRPEPTILDASRYVDAVNFASRCKAEAILSVGFIDSVCPPASCYAAYNCLQGSKEIVNKPGMSHAAPADIQQRFFAKLLEHVKANRPANQLQPVER